MKKYFPFPYRIVKGNIVDSYGNNSQSIDCVVLNPSHPYTIDTDNERASIIFADGVDYAIEIKSDLSSENEIERALRQIQLQKMRRMMSRLKYYREQLNLFKWICVVTCNQNGRRVFLQEAMAESFLTLLQYAII